MKNYLRIICTASGVLLAVAAAVGSTLEVHDSWIREAPPTASVLAAYMVISNSGEYPVEITAVASPDFDHTELHRTVLESGVASMVPIEKLEIPAGGKISLEPGGVHLMLISPLHPLREGDSATLILQSADGSSDRITTPVKRETGEAADRPHH